MDDRRAKLEAELRAIEVWDSEYRRNAFHDKTDEIAYRARRERRREIMQEIEVGAFPLEVHVERSLPECPEK